MTTYYDLTTKEKAALTEEQLSRFVAIDLMQNGIEPAIGPDLVPVPYVPAPTVQRVECAGIIFKDYETAQKFLALGPERSDYDYQISYEHKYLVPVSQDVTPVMFYTKSEVVQLGSVMKAAKEVKANNKAEDERYAKELASIRNATEFLYADYRSALRSQRDAERVLQTYEDYKALSGDDYMAYQFLLKTYPDAASAFEMMGVKVPVDPATLPRADKPMEVSNA